MKVVGSFLLSWHNSWARFHQYYLWSLYWPLELPARGRVVKNSPREQEVNFVAAIFLCCKYWGGHNYENVKTQCVKVIEGLWLVWMVNLVFSNLAWWSSLPFYRKYPGDWKDDGMSGQSRNWKEKHWMETPGHVVDCLISK